jgi:hypothetical protein
MHASEVKLMAFFTVTLDSDMINSRARYGIIASLHSFRTSPETLSGPNDLVRLWLLIFS